MEWSIQEIARHAGTTSRTLRHYDDLGLVPPSRIGANGYRYYDETALVRLQRVLLLRSEERRVGKSVGTGRRRCTSAEAAQRVRNEKESRCQKRKTRGESSTCEH